MTGDESLAGGRIRGIGRKRALKVAFVVGSILAVINHGDALLSGAATVTVWVKIVLTFLVPYCVATFASVQAIRHAARKN